MVPNSAPQLPGQYYWSHDGYAIVNSYRKFNKAAQNSTNITNPMHQSPHAQIATSFTRPFCAISLHQSWDGLQHSANCNREVVLHVRQRCSQFNQYCELHAQIAARTNRHIPRPTNKPWILIRLMMISRLQFAMGMNFLGWIMMEGSHQGMRWINMEGRNQGRRIA